MPGKYNHASTYQSCETISARQQYVRAAEEQLSVRRGVHASATLGAVAIMVKSERRGDRIISAFTGREAPAGSCRGGGAGHPGRPPWIKKTGSRPRSRDARTELRDGEYFV